MPVDAFLTKTITTSGAAAQYPTGPIASGGANVDEFDTGPLLGTEGLQVVINVTAVSGTGGPTFTPTLERDDNVAFSTPVVVWTCPVAITAVGLYAYPAPAVRELTTGYLRMSTGAVGGTTPVFTFSAYLAKGIPSGRMT